MIKPNDWLSVSSIHLATLCYVPPLSQQPTKQCVYPHSISFDQLSPSSVSSGNRLDPCHQALTTSCFAPLTHSLTSRRAFPTPPSPPHSAAGQPCSFLLTQPPTKPITTLRPCSQTYSVYLPLLSITLYVGFEYLAKEILLRVLFVSMLASMSLKNTFLAFIHSSAIRSPFPTLKILLKLRPFVCVFVCVFQHLSLSLSCLLTHIHTRSRRSLFSSGRSHIRITTRLSQHLV